MIRLFSIAILAITALSCNQRELKQPNISNEVDSLKIEIASLQEEIAKLKSTPTEIEDDSERFSGFFYRFMTDSIFQINRIMFPLTYIHWKDFVLGEEIDTTEIDQKDWKHEWFYMEGFHYVPQVYDNFEMELRPSKKRLLHLKGVESGGDAKYFFEVEDKKWYLTKLESLGD